MLEWPQNDDPVENTVTYRNPTGEAVDGSGFSHLVETPAMLTEYYNVTDHLAWNSEFVQLVETDEGWYEEQTREVRGVSDHEPGQTYQEVWNSAVFGPGFITDGLWAARDGQTLELDLPVFSGPGPDQYGYSKTDTGHTALYRGDELIGDYDHANYGVITGLPEEEQEYRLVMEADRSTVSTVSTSVAYEWTCTSSAEEFQPTFLAVRLAPRGLDGTTGPRSARRSRSR